MALVELRERMWRGGRPLVAGDGRRRHGEPAVPRRRARTGCAPTTPCCPRRASRTRAGSRSDRVWIIDPLDGTREYGEPGRHDWAVHVALWADGALRRRRRQPAGARRRVRDRSAAGRCRRSSASGRGWSRRATAAPYAAAVVAHALDADAVRLGSAGAKAMAVVNGEADIYVHDGGMYQWDSAAPAAVAAGRRAARQPHRRLADRLQRPRSVAARLHRVPPGVGRARAVRPLGRLRASHAPVLSLIVQASSTPATLRPLSALPVTWLPMTWPSTNVAPPTAGCRGSGGAPGRGPSSCCRRW